ncbi:MAG: hypothetical protein HYU69_03170 [Bacteroidetes bacterium]|nr:hypothetical protein [Bacteroidota bacterium]
MKTKAIAVTRLPGSVIFLVLMCLSQFINSQNTQGRWIEVKGKRITDNPIIGDATLSLPAEYRLYDLNIEELKNELHSGRRVLISFEDDYRWEVDVERFDIRTENYILNSLVAKSRYTRSLETPDPPETYRSKGSN